MCHYMLITFLTSSYFRRKASTSGKDVFHQPDVTPEELHLINKRIELRKALRAEYLRKVTDPHSTEPYIVSLFIYLIFKYNFALLL